MLRFFAACVVLAALCVGAVVLLGQGGLLSSPQTSDPDKKEKPSPGASSKPRPADTEGSTSTADSSSTRTEQATQVDDDKAARVSEVKTVAAASQPLILQDGRILPTQRQDVPSERDGKLLFLATPMQRGEVVSTNKLLPPFEFAILAVPVKSWDGIPEEEQLLDDNQPGKKFRRVRSTDSLAPGTTEVIRRKIQLRRLDIGDRVHQDQLLGVINPAVATEELLIKSVKLDGAEADVRAAVAFKEESYRAYIAMSNLNQRVKGAVSLDDLGRGKATFERYKEEENAKRAAVKQAERELSQAWTTLKMHEVRASIDGVIKAIYKQPGEAVKNLDPVLQIQNPGALRVEVQVEVQEALSLRDRMERARKYRSEAQRLRLRGNSGDQVTAGKYMEMADALLKVEVEASRIEPPQAVLGGHHQEVTCVAVTRESQPRIISGSEDRTVRIWTRLPGNDNRWQQTHEIAHHAAVRAVACTTGTKGRNLLLTGTSTGRGRIFDLDNLKAGEVMLQGRHSAAINVVAFNADGTLCATGGDDRAICLWETTEGKLLGRKSGAHGAGVTSLAFTPGGQLVSAGKDRKLILWNLVEGIGEGGKSLVHAGGLDRRSGDVQQLGIDPTGQYALFDEGRELRVVSQAAERIEGTLSNPPGTANFSTLALYSPDGYTILTNSNAVGRLQLWRAPTAKTRASELRNYVWTSGMTTSGAFDPKNKFVVTGTQDSKILVWAMPTQAEAEKPLSAKLSYVEEFLDTSLRRVAVRATVDQPPTWIIPGGSATVVVPHLASR
jgi:WD40 repeat protein